MPSKISLTFLGTSDAIPSETRNHSAMLLNYNEENILVDCGEGTQRQFRKAGLNPCKITKILISHWHGDHVLGIPGILQTLELSGYNKTLEIYGPKGTKRFMDQIISTFLFDCKYKIKIFEVEGKFCETNAFYLEAEKMTHGAPCNSYSFVLKDQIRIDKSKLRKSGIKEGPFLRELKQGKDISFNGKKYKAKDLTFLEKGKKICFIMDTSFNNKMISFSKNSDLLVSESTFSEEEEEHAKEYNHLTAKQAAETAKKSNSKKLFLTHLSQRYEKCPEKILKEAKKVFKNSFLAKDLQKVEL